MLSIPIKVLSLNSSEHSVNRYLKTILLSSLFISCVEAEAVDFNGLNITGEASFDYTYLSSGDNAYPGISGAKSDAYHFVMAQMLVQKETEQLSFSARLSYIPTNVQTDATTSTTSTLGTLDQLEVYYKIRPDFLVGFGRLCTTLGFESAMKSENVFYNPLIATQSLVPGYGEGMRARYNPGEYLAVSLSTYNQSTYNKFGDDYTPTKTTEVSLTGVAGRLLWFAGYYWGTDIQSAAPNDKVDKTYGNGWFTYTASEQLSFSASYDARSAKVQGGVLEWAQSVSGQAAYVMSEHTFGVRYETLLGAGSLDSLAGTTGAYYSGASKVEAWTVSDKYKLTENLNLYLEYHGDKADANVLKNKDGDDTDSGYIITLGAVAHF